MVEAYARLNRSPMGTGVLSNSVWPLDRERMAQLLGFEGIVENSLDSSQIAPFDNQLEAADIAQSGAIRVGALMQDLHTQYHQTKPWLLLQEGSTYTSSSMPQKRNPGLIMGARMKASDVVGLAEAAVTRAHNVTTGMVDYKSEVEDLGVLTTAAAMAKAANTVFGALVVNKERARAELDADWTATMNLAEVLLKDHDVPFRVGHGFASLLVSYARPLDFTPSSIPFEAVTVAFAKALEKYKLPKQPFPMSEVQFREVMSPAWIVEHTQGTGGPQPAEVRRMLAEAQKRLLADRNWLNERHAQLKRADAELDSEFGKILPKGPNQ
jgi:argininosuccinate lyase